MSMLNPDGTVRPGRTIGSSAVACGSDSGVD